MEMTLGNRQLAFNHAMVYSRDVAAAVHFYANVLGLKLLEEFKAGDRTAGPGEEVRTGGVRLYFEIKDLEKFCKRLADSDVKFSKRPALMPGGWKHAYLDDPDGHEVSLYWAGRKRLQKAKAATPPARPAKPTKAARAGK
jgi:catechol 2,3-dioxygenase-like lactoylglutathione lyase family enzyme